MYCIVLYCFETWLQYITPVILSTFSKVYQEICTGNTYCCLVFHKLFNYFNQTILLFRVQTDTNKTEERNKKRKKERKKDRQTDRWMTEGRTERKEKIKRKEDRQAEDGRKEGRDKQAKWAAMKTQWLGDQEGTSQQWLRLSRLLLNTKPTGFKTYKLLQYLNLSAYKSQCTVHVYICLSLCLYSYMYLHLCLCLLAIHVVCICDIFYIICVWVHVSLYDKININDHNITWGCQVKFT